VTDRVDRRTFLIAAVLLGPVAVAGTVAAARRPTPATTPEAGAAAPDEPRYEVSVETRYTTDGVPYLAAVAREI
jgi:Flp pilus assembly protein CpaB